MEPQTILELKLLTGVTTSHANRWWADALRNSIEQNESFQLKVLTEKQLEVDTQRNKQGYYISYPCFRNSAIPADGFYHLNVQGSNYMFVGWMIITNGKAAWWGQTGSDHVMTGVAGHDVALANFFPEIDEWSFNFHYIDKWEKGTTLGQILKKF